MALVPCCAQRISTLQYSATQKQSFGLVHSICSSSSAAVRSLKNFEELHEFKMEKVRPSHDPDFGCRGHVVRQLVPVHRYVPCPCCAPLSNRRSNGSYDN